MKKEPDTITFRIDPELRKLLKMRAEIERRSVSSMLRIIIEESLKEIND